MAKAVSRTSEFRKTFPFGQWNTAKWFPGHMFKGMMKMQSKIKSVDCVIEVHDARVPFSGRNPNFKERVIGNKPHILLLNKMDLIDTKYMNQIKDKIKAEEKDTNILLTCAKDHGKDFALKKLLPLALKMIENKDRYHRTFTAEYCLMIIGVPNVGKSTFINALRHKNMNKGKAALVGAKAGVTRVVSEKIKILEDPLTYLLDTPGILSPRIRNPEAGMRLALCGCLQDHLIGETVMADYLLYWLNKHQNFRYLSYMDLTEPSDDIDIILTKSAVKMNKYLKMKDYNTGQMVYRPNTVAAASHFVRGFRTGAFGPILLDYDHLQCG